MQGTKSRQFDLESLLQENAIDEAIRISSLDGWSKVEQIGEGRFGEVWIYATPNKETPIAAGKHLKVQLWNLNEKQKTDLKARVNDFIAELNTLYKISSACSEHFVQFIGCYLGSRKLILFTEYMKNGSIREQILDNVLDEATALKYTYQTTQGLNFLHHYQGGRIVHRDIKCENLLLTSSYDVKLADFGLAHNLAVDNESYTMSQSAPCGFAGTVIYAAPEVLVGRPYGRRADIWSLGCTLVEMLTSHPPHANFWEKHKERAQFLFIEQAQADSSNQLQYIGHQLVPNASELVQRLLDCLFTKNEANRPTSDDVLGVFSENAPVPHYKIDGEKLQQLELKVKENRMGLNTSSSVRTAVGDHARSE
uniref:non-specific serine/threonine protein kinase n=1 Tax=Plectus sambesii TaxID=2011161 RepID=A0A914X240_9BILA